MYAVFRAGGKQYRASKGERLKLEKLEADEGTKVSFDEVLLVGEGGDIEVGSPLVAGASVSATVLRQGRSRKVTVTKFRRRQNYLRQHSHRQWFTEIEITAIGSTKSGTSADQPAESKAAADGGETQAAPATEKSVTMKATTRKTATTKAGAEKTTVTAAGTGTVSKKKTAKKAGKKKAAPKAD